MSRVERLPGHEGDGETTAALIADIRRLIAETRAGVAATVNAGLTMLYWRIGRRVRKDMPARIRAEYGERVIATLATELAQEFGQSFGEKPLRNMLRFADAFPDEEIVSTLWRQLSWSHFRKLAYIVDPANASSTRRCAGSSGGACGR